jgi:SAM-dependent methyltransferase
MIELPASKEVKQFYQNNPYPAYGTAAKTKAANAYAKYCVSRPGKYLEAGCGTGHVVAGSAITLSNFEFYAIDFNDASFEIAKTVAEANNVKINFQQTNLMEPLPFGFEFEYINCLGVRHHLENPEQGLANLFDKLSVSGYLFIHVYSEEYHRRRFQTAEMLDLISDESDDYQYRYELYLTFEKHARARRQGSLLRRLVRLSIRDIILGKHGIVKQRKLGDTQTTQAWDGPWDDSKVSER